MNVDVYAPGTEVIFDNGIRARVMEVHIYSSDNITYTCVWWNGEERLCADVASWELTEYQPEN